MNGDIVYQHKEVKEPGFLKKLYRWGSCYAEEDLSRGVSDRNNLIENIQQARQEWSSAAANFDQAENEDLIDYYIYRMKACQVRYNYLLKMAKETGLKQNLYEAQ